MTSISLLIKYSRANTKDYWIGLLGKLGSEALNLTLWGLVGYYLITPENFDLTIALVVSACVFLLQWIFGQTTRQSFSGAYEISQKLRSQLLSDVRKQPLGLLLGSALGSRLKVVTSDIKQFEDVFSHIASEFISAWVVPIGLLAALLFLVPAAGMTLLTVLLLAIVVLVIAEKTFTRLGKNLETQRGEVSNSVLEYVRCLPMLRSFGAAHQLSKPTVSKIEELRAQGLGIEWAAGTSIMLATWILELAIPAVAIVAVVLSLNNADANATTLALSILFTIGCLRPLSNIAIFAAVLRYLVMASGRIYALSSVPIQPTEGVKPSKFDIDIANVSFQQDGTSILNNVTIQMAAGSKTAIVGKSGSGKSSLLNLIASFYNPTNGEIKIGGSNLNQTGTVNWYQSLSYITQNVEILAGTIAENLRLAKPDASDQELWDAINRAQLNDVVERLDNGLESILGENGQTLSGGERQRLSIARAFLHDAPILLLDEITASLDHHIQGEILKELAQFSQNKTVVSVAHRLHSIIDADNIVLMKDGSLVSQGSHAHLLENSSEYRTLYKLESSQAIS